MLTLGKILDMILKYHRQAISPRLMIRKPWAWAIYQTWKWVDEHEKGTIEEEEK